MSADAEFARVAREYLDDRAERHPDIATGLGDHRFDARLADPSAQARDDERRALDGWAARLAAVDHGTLSAEQQYPGEGDPRAVRMQQLKMLLRTIINAILDARIHGHGMTETEAITLMTRRGFQEEGEAAGKWRRAQLTSAQLSTYYVGYCEISDLADDLRAADPSLTDQQVHDRMLAHGSPPVRLLRTLIAS